MQRTFANQLLRTTFCKPTFTNQLGPAQKEGRARTEISAGALSRANLRSAAPPGTSVLDRKGKGFLLSLHQKCLPRIFFPEFCPSKLLNPSLFLSPAPRTFRRPGPRWRQTSWFGIFFSNFCFQNTFQNLTFKQHRKKLENKGFWPPKTVPKPFKNPSQIDVPEQA